MRLLDDLGGLGQWKVLSGLLPSLRGSSGFHLPELKGKPCKEELKEECKAKVSEYKQDK